MFISRSVFTCFMLGLMIPGVLCLKVYCLGFSSIDSKDTQLFLVGLVALLVSIDTLLKSRQIKNRS